MIGFMGMKTGSIAGDVAGRGDAGDIKRAAATGMARK